MQPVDNGRSDSGCRVHRGGGSSGHDPGPGPAAGKQLLRDRWIGSQCAPTPCPVYNGTMPSPHSGADRGADDRSDDASTIDFAALTDELAASALNDRDWYNAEAARLVRPGDRLAVDVGCGAGGMARALVAAGVPRVIATDGNLDVLEAAGALDGDGIEFLLAELPQDFAALADELSGTGADVIWAAGSVHHLGDQQAAISGLAELVAVGGRLAIAEGGLTVRHLPADVGVGGFGLEDRLQVAHLEWFAGMRAGLAGSVPMPYGWPDALRRAGLDDVTTHSTVLEQPTPLSKADREHVLDALAWKVDRNTEAGTLPPEDVTAWRQLLDPKDPAWLGGRSDLFSLRVYSVHVGVNATG